MATQVEQMLADLESLIYNPPAIQDRVLSMVTEISNGTISLVDPTNPVVMNLECAAILSAATLTKIEALTRRLYSKVVTDEEGLYLHMADTDYVNRFATPATAIFTLVFNIDELESNFIAVSDLGIGKLRIPRNTKITINGITFSLQYPIDIRKMAHGGYQVIYDGSIASPLQTLVSNSITPEIKMNGDGKWLVFPVEMQQFNIISKIGTFNRATAFNTSIPLEDEFYYCRVYYENSAGKWVEMKTTHTEEIFDPSVPTAVIKVLSESKTVKVSIPQIYTTTNQLNSSCRVDVYQTKGPLKLSMADYPSGQFEATWLTIDNKEDTTFSAPLNTFKSLIIYSTDKVDGGSNPINFETLRNRVITNSDGPIDIPITPDQLNTKIEVNGYAIVKNVDLVTDRKFLATKSLPDPSNNVTQTPAAASIGTLSTTMEGMLNFNGCIDNGARVTITPNALFKMKSNIISLMTSSDVKYLLSLPLDQRASVVSANSYLYTPFHYVLDSTAAEFEIRPYYLDSPKITSKQYVQENDTTLINVSVGSYSIVKDEDGYLIHILTSSDDSYKKLSDDDLTVQLAFIPPGSSARAYVNGKLTLKNTDGERLFEFRISSNFDLDSDHNLIINNFYMYTTDSKKLPMMLNTNFDVFFTTTSAVGSQYVGSNVEDNMGLFLLPIGSKGIKQEKLTINFGAYLETLWSAARTVISSADYATYELNIPEVYSEDIYEVDQTTGAIFKIVNGEIIYNKLHSKGDPVLNTDGSVRYAHKVGEIIYDSQGNPTIKKERGLKRLCDIFLVDGRYWFGTSASVIAYRQELAETLTTWITKDLADIEKILLENSEVYFRPKTSVGDIKILNSNGSTTTIAAQQSLEVKLYVSEAVYNDEVLKTKLEEITIDTIMSHLSNNKVIAISNINDDLKAVFGTDVIGFNVSGLGGSYNYDVVTIIDDAARLSIDKKLIALADGTLTVADSIVIDIIKHKVS